MSADLEEIAKHGRRKARKYRELAREVDQRSGARVLAATTPSGKEVTGRPRKLRKKFEKSAERWANLASSATDMVEMERELEGLRERISHLEAKRGIHGMTGASRNGHGRP